MCVFELLSIEVSFWEVLRSANEAGAWGQCSPHYNAKEVGLDCSDGGNSQFPGKVVWDACGAESMRSSHQFDSLRESFIKRPCNKSLNVIAVSIAGGKGQRQKQFIRLWQFCKLEHKPSLSVSCYSGPLWLCLGLKRSFCSFAWALRRISRSTRNECEYVVKSASVSHWWPCKKICCNSASQRTVRWGNQFRK